MYCEGAAMRLIIAAFAASLAFGQTTKVFQLTQNQSPQDLEEIARILRIVANIDAPLVDKEARILTANGPDVNIKTAIWLVQQLDLPAKGQYSGVHEYRSAVDPDNITRVFYLHNTPEPRVIQEIITAVRSVADIQRLMVYNPLHVIALRTDQSHVTLAAFLIDQLDQHDGTPAPEPHELQVDGDKLVARVFELRNPQTPEQLQEITTLVRSVADIMRLFVINNRKALVMRAEPERVTLAAWLVKQLDLPVPPSDSTPRAYTFEIDQRGEHVQDEVRVLYLPQALPDADRAKIMNEVRSNTRIRRVFVYNAIGALALRGEAEDIAIAERLIKKNQEKASR
jgi:hypothetical protein